MLDEKRDETALLTPKPGTNSDFKSRLLEFWQYYREPITMWAGWRVALLILPFFAGFLFPASTAPWNQNPPFPPTDSIWLERLVCSWAHWDGGFYNTIAREGYISEAHLAFYPLYPHLLRWFTFILSFGNLGYETINISGIVISSMAALASCLLLFRLARLDYDEEVSQLSVLYLLSFPVAFYLFAVYTESLFMALALGAFLSVRYQKWLVALLLATLCVLTKNQGLFVPLALLVEFSHQRGWKPRRILDFRLAYYLLPLLGLGGWMLYNQLETGNPLKFLTAQTYFERSFGSPLFTLRAATEYFFNTRDSGTFLPKGYLEDSYLYDYPITLAFIGLALLGVWAVWKGKLRPSYLVFFLLCLIQPLTSPNKTIILLGMPRYMLIIFPAFFLLALIGRRWRFFHYLYLGLSLPLFSLLLARFVLNYWV